MADLCFSDKMSKDDSKARAMPQPFMLCGLLMHSGAETGQPRPRIKIRCKKIELLKNAARLRFAHECWLSAPCAVVITTARGDALFALAALHWYRSHACQPVAMHLSMLY